MGAQLNPLDITEADIKKAEEYLERDKTEEYQKFKGAAERIKEMANDPFSAKLGLPRGLGNALCFIAENVVPCIDEIIAGDYKNALQIRERLKSLEKKLF